MNEHDIEQVLRQRALALAQGDRRAQADQSESLVVFSIGGQTFGVPLADVAYAGRLRHLTPIPSGVSHLLGITLLSGFLISVLDVATLLSLRRQGVGDVTCCLVVQCGGRDIGLAAEQVVGIEEIPVRDISAISIGGGTGAITRVALLQRLQVLIIDVARLIADPRLKGGARDG